MAVYTSHPSEGRDCKIRVCGLGWLCQKVTPYLQNNQIKMEGRIAQVVE
jgi:hypothetical protein